jgi:hypothetical protein
MRTRYWTRHWHLILGAAAASISLACGHIASAQEVEATSPSSLYIKFKDFRTSLADPDSYPMKFFSRNLIEQWCGSLLKNRQLDFDVNTLRVARNRFRFGELIHVVESYSVSDGEGSSKDLTLSYEEKDDPRTHKVTIVYVAEGGEWRVDKIHYLLSGPPTVQGTTPVDVFN